MAPEVRVGQVGLVESVCSRLGIAKIRVEDHAFDTSLVNSSAQCRPEDTNLMYGTS